MDRHSCSWRNTASSIKLAPAHSAPSTHVSQSSLRPAPRLRIALRSQIRINNTIQEKKGKGDGQLQYEIKLYQLFQGISNTTYIQQAYHVYLTRGLTQNTIDTSW